MEENHLTENSLGAFNENEQGTSKVSQEGEVDTNVVPEVGMHFDTHEAARQFYDQYAKHKGFFTKIKRSWKSKDGDDLSAIIYTCYKAGSKNINRGTLSDRGTSLSDCKALMKVKRMETKWRITEIILDHNHELTSSNLWLPRPRRRKNSGVKKKLKKRLIVDQRPSTRRHMIISSNETETLPNAQPGTFSRETGDSMWTPADIKELTNSYIYIVDMPGLKSEDIKVQIENSNVLIVGGERKRNESEDPESKYIKRERVKKFMRKFILPADANMDAISAICRDSVLTVAVAKTPPEPKRPKIFEVKVG